ncbi:hypothetical protein BACINT_00856 [Bacteroides intestinalis DSM 17393]|uniref:Uncharacterized protein n=1 Tax=Bacteroides intestinalis DSM 17393 TaxID=471870 RepID=B3C7G5_9BACE|nr:hypothetical protein BACINT_00856 [Bacteroides intestinalis DSM 17393]
MENVRSKYGFAMVRVWSRSLKKIGQTGLLLPAHYLSNTTKILYDVLILLIIILYS